MNACPKGGDKPQKFWEAKSEKSRLVPTVHSCLSEQLQRKQFLHA